MDWNWEKQKVNKHEGDCFSAATNQLNEGEGGKKSK